MMLKNLDVFMISCIFKNNLFPYIYDRKAI